LTEHLEPDSFGPNEWLVDDMFRRYQENPKAVSEAWRDFFEGFTPRRGSAPSTPTQAASPVPPPPPNGQSQGSREAPPVRPVTAPPSNISPEEATPLRGITARIAENMEASLGMPTATSVRTIPAKLLEENRRIINRYLRARGAKVSFTHMIGWAVLKALGARPGMKVSYAVIDGKPHIVEHKHVNFGLAVDVQRADGRVLMVPNVKNADELDFNGFWSAYEDVIKRVRSNKLTPDDFAGTNVTLTNPGTVGTHQSVPRLMPSQGAIIGVGAISYPPEYKGADARTLAQLGVSKVITLTSTYDHRVIQGAESGQFLAQVEELMLGGDRFYDEIFASLHIPYEPARWAQDRAIESVDDQLQKQSRVIQLINMFRVRGHFLAELNPIGWEVLSHPELDLSHYGLSVWDLDREFLTDGLPGPQKQPLRSIVDTLRDAYCRTIGVEYMHISDPEQKRWIQGRVEGTTEEELSKDDKKHILDRLTAAEAFERFLHSKYMGHKRFSLEGAESLIPMLDALYEEATKADMLEVVMGMSHRGRLNVLANTVGKALKQIFKEFEGDIDPETVQGSGDVKYHLGMTGTYTSRNGDEMRVVLASNPSHLEAVDPVVVGMTRAKQDLIGEDADQKVMSVLLHGDAAFAGQGVVAETLNMWDLPGYRVGGTVHIVVNNNIGFTTAPAQGRSSTYATDIAKMIQAPIFHVNGDDPEACVRVMRLAFEFRQRFGKDVVVDLVCYRRHGHNEADEPAFTQPLMYAKIDDRRSVRKIYLENLLNRGELTVEEAEKSFEDFRGMLQKAFEETKEALSSKEGDYPAPEPMYASQDVATAVSRERLDQVLGVITSFPQGFEPHPKLKKMIDKRA
jgi:multifunctional 2-oxoglutarate metabolism enzyme